MRSASSLNSASVTSIERFIMPCFSLSHLLAGTFKVLCRFTGLPLILSRRSKGKSAILGTSDFPSRWGTRMDFRDAKGLWIFFLFRIEHVSFLLTHQTSSLDVWGRSNVSLLPVPLQAIDLIKVDAYENYQTILDSLLQMWNRTFTSEGSLIAQHQCWRNYRIESLAELD